MMSGIVGISGDNSSGGSSSASNKATHGLGKHKL